MYNWSIRYCLCCLFAQPFFGSSEVTSPLAGVTFIRLPQKDPNRRIVLDSRPLIIDDDLRCNSFHPDFLDDYPDATEDVGTDFPMAYGQELDTTVFFDADHGHDHVTRRSISGLIVFVGSTPVIWISKQQDVLQQAYTMRNSLSLCKLQWRRLFRFVICFDAWECRLQSRRTCSVTILESFRVPKFPTVSLRRNISRANG